MKLARIVVCVGALAGLAACETATDAEVVRKPTVLPPPPEYLACKDVPRELAIADKYALELGVYDAQGAYWFKRSERLASRAYECKTRGR